jgi:hypothetical protein
MPSVTQFLRGLVSTVKEVFEKVVRLFAFPEEVIQVPTVRTAVIDQVLFEAHDTLNAHIHFKTCYIERLSYDGEDLSFAPPGDWQWGGRVVVMTPQGEIMYVDRRLPRGEVYDEWKIVSLAIEEIGEKVFGRGRYTSKMVRDLVLDVLPFQERIVRASS